jgi:hypothetical protein
MMDEPLPLEPVAEAGLAQDVDSALLEYPGPDPALDMPAAADLQHNRLDALQVQQM